MSRTAFKARPCDVLKLSLHSVRLSGTLPVHWLYALSTALTTLGGEQ